MFFFMVAMARRTGWKRVVVIAVFAHVSALCPHPYVITVSGRTDPSKGSASCLVDVLIIDITRSQVENAHVTVCRMVLDEKASAFLDSRRMESRRPPPTSITVLLFLTRRVVVNARSCFLRSETTWTVERWHPHSLWRRSGQ